MKWLTKVMKYPQLVSPRAVNAISDWLVSRLEQLGVESPQIYTRLLLSLLQSSVQVNDPIEFSNLETFFANRKGGHKRFHLPSDTETLKKLNAVQCLREIVANEQETATIEQLVDELCEKLKDIEKQTQDLSDEERFLIETHHDTDSILQNQHNTQLQNLQQGTSSNYNNNPHYHTRHHQQQQQQQHYHHHHHHHHNHPQQQQQDIHNSLKANNAAINLETKRQHVLSTSATKTDDALNDLENDPKKRYFRAFPALSKEMEDSFRIWRRNAKSLTWPVVGRSIVVDNLNNSSASLSSSSASSIISSSNFGANTKSTDKSAEKKLKGVVGVGHQLENRVNTDISGSVYSGHIGGSDEQQQQQLQGAVAASAKKKSKRRRNQALCKGKTIQNLRKLSVGTTSNSVGGSKYHQYTHQRNCSPAWDTDFKGCWEMGPDLIKDFLSRQNGKKRNRSHSAVSMEEHEARTEHEILNEVPAKDDENPMMKRYIDLSFCYEDDDEGEISDHDHDENLHQRATEGVDYVDEDYDDNTLASVSELVIDNFNPKRLYQREGGHSTKKTLAFGGTIVMGNFASADNTLEDAVDDSVDPLDFQQFKAKFNSSVEALWKNASSTTPASSTQQTTKLTKNSENSLKLSNPLGSGISSAFYATTSLNALAPFKKDLWNFWSNYQQHDFDEVKNKLPPTTASTTSSMLMTTRLDDNSAGSGAGADIATSSDYFSMPSNLNDFDKSVGSVRRTNDTGASLGAHTPSINVFLRNSIWSTSDDCVDALGSTSAITTAADTDESFLFKVWHSNKKLSELDVGNAAKGEKMSTLVVDNDGVNGTEFNTTRDVESSSIMVNNQSLGANLQFPPYQNLKWSEGINAGPPFSSLRTNHNINHQADMQSINHNTTCLRNENKYASFSSVASLSGATWEAPAFGQNAQPDLKSWCASNPISLTEMYGNDVCDSIVNQPPEEEPEPNQKEIVMGPAVTLPNHCAQTSGFVAYSRIKQSGLIKPLAKPLQSANNAACLPKDFFRSGEEENLLTSERTHFHPIENFVDGHTFDINNSLDSIEFERTSSGLMRYDSEEYLEYTRSDIYMADEEVSTHSTNLLKYGRKPNEDKDKKDAFIIKFRVKRSEEIASQTDEQHFELAATKMIDLPTTSVNLKTFPPPLPVNNMFHNTFSLSRQANNEAIMAAVTKAVAAAAKAAAENHLSAGRFCWLPNTNTATDTDSKASANAKNANTGETNSLWRPDNSICDEVDFCQTDNSIREQQQQLAKNWSMQEVEKQCHQRRCLPQPPEMEINRQLPTKIDLDRSDENSLDNTSLHTLWGMCAVCNSCDFDKSMPANRLLRDELQLEADEIMSDLRYMQDLYIGESNILSETTEDDSTSGQTDLSTDDKMFDYLNKDFETNSMRDSWNMMDIKETKTHHQHDANQVSMLQKVNQLIEDLLKPDNKVKLPKERNEQQEDQLSVVDVWHVQQGEHNKRKNLWQFTEQKNDDNMWQNKTLTEPEPEQFEEKLSKLNENTLAKSRQLRKEVERCSKPDNERTQTLNWQHDNLAKIWQPSSIPANNTQLEETLLKHKQNEMANKILYENVQIQQPLEDSLDDDSLKFVEEQNLKNLQNTNDLTPPASPSPSPSTTLNYKRVQQFLNNSAAKMKLAANRKRRHSASQNFYQQQHLHNGNNNNNNNNSEGITNLNSYKQELNDTFEMTKEQQPQRLTSYNEVSAEEQPTKQTIITCKYWTAATNGTQSSLDSAAAAMMLLAAATNATTNTTNDLLTNAITNTTTTTADNYDEEDVMLNENVFGDTTFSGLINKNASILKHVTMMTRPLTR